MFLVLNTNELKRHTGGALHSVFVERCQNLIYHLDKCGVLGNMWEEKKDAREKILFYCNADRR